MVLYCSRCHAPVNPAARAGASSWCPSCRAEGTTAAAPTHAAAEPAALPVAVPDGAPTAVAQPARPARAVTPPPLPPPLPSCPRVPLPDGMPAEVAALGDPEAVYAPDPKQVAFNRTLVHGIAGGITVALLGLAALMIYAYFQPAVGANRPPQVVFLFVAAGFGVAGLGAFAAGRWTTSSVFGRNRWGPRTYLVYRDALAEVFPERHRVIPVVKIRAPQANTVVVSVYRFPVDGEKPLTFDNTVSDHAGFAALLQARSAERRFVAVCGGEAMLAGLRGARPGPSVLAVNPTLVAEVYRITELGDRLLFYKVAAPLGLCPTPPPNPLRGLVGAVAAWTHARERRKFLDEMRAVERADAATLLALAARNDGSFMAAAGDIRAARLDPPSAVREFLFGIRDRRQQALLKLVHATKGTITLALLSPEDVATVRDWWPQILGGSLQVNGLH